MTVARGGKRGKTSGRGGKGQSARAGNKRRPEWRDIIKRLPKLRGRGVNLQKSFAERPVVLNIDVLEVAFEAKETVSPATLIEKGLISNRSGYMPLVKLLGEGEITKAFMVTGCIVSASAAEKIAKAGGTITPPKGQTPVSPKPAAKPAPKKEKAPVAQESAEAAPKKESKPKAEKKTEKKPASKVEKK